jgi:hypothetical protein
MADPTIKAIKKLEKAKADKFDRIDVQMDNGITYHFASVDHMKELIARPSWPMDEIGLMETLRDILKDDAALSDVSKAAGKTVKNHGK